MNSFVYQVFFFILIYIKSAHNYPTGAPALACETMTPNHGVSSQQCSSKYIIQSDKSQYNTNETVSISVNGSTSSDTFRGVLLIAKTQTTGQIIGNWSVVGSTIQTLACDGIANTGVTHNSNNDKTSIQAIWYPPSTVSAENTIIKATVVTVYNQIYVDCFSVTLTKRQNNQTTSNNGTTTISSISSSSTTTVITTTTSPTSGVGVNISWTYTNGVTAVQMKINNLKTSQWLALGLSLDSYMGDDHVFVCRRLSDDTVTVDRRVNPGGHSPPVLASTIPTAGGTFNATSTSLNNGVVNCAFTLSNFGSSKRRRRDISPISPSTTYYPLIAFGNLDTSNELIQHTTRSPLSQSLQLNQQETILYNLGTSSSSTTTVITTTTTPTSDIGVSISWTYTNGVTAVQMTISNLKTSQWLALGLSLDSYMGDDHVFVCKRLSDDTVTVDRRVNPGGHSPPVPASTIPTAGGTFNATSTRLDNGVVNCAFSLSNFGGSKRRRRDISPISPSTLYYPLIAFGNLDTSNELIQHTTRSPLSQSVQLNQQETIVYNLDTTDSRFNLVKAHGIIMIFTWLLFVSTGILIALYFKSAWPEKKICGKAIWFAIHRALMISVTILAITAFILILVYAKGEWISQSYQPQFAHSICGIIAICFAIIQPIMALFRCKPDGEYRFIFNYIHGIVGSTAFVLSIVAIYLALFFPQLNLTANKDWGILVAYTCWLPIIFFIFWFIEFYFRKYKSNEGNLDSYDLGNTTTSKTEKIPPVYQVQQDRIKLAFLIMHILIALGLSLALASLVGKS